MKYFYIIIIILINQFVFSQPNRINYNNQQLFLSGANLAWVNFGNDIGPGSTDFNRFADVMLQQHDNGGNALRIWLHIDGRNTPAFYNSNFVTGLGAGTVEDLRAILDLAWEREIGMKLCLWSFDMLRSNLPSGTINRNTLLLTDTSYTHSYINNALIPLIDSLKGHPAIIAWEIFNEPEGMSNEFGWPEINHVPMSAIQRFINLCTGAIHRTDTTALVTSGCWSFQAMNNLSALPVVPPKFTSNEKEELVNFINQKYNFSLSADEIIGHLEKTALVGNNNYYSDSALTAEGGDPDGILDFYSAHYYVHLGAAYSPFAHSRSYWQLDKAVVIAEFAMQPNDGVPAGQLFNRLYQTGYAGALPWSWTDINISPTDSMLAGMKFMWDNYRSAVDILGISGEWPYITITSPAANTQFPGNSEVTIETDAYDNDGYVDIVKFFVNDTLKIGERDTIPFNIIWSGMPDGNYSLSAEATDNSGNKRTSAKVNIIVGSPPFTRREAESTQRIGNMTVESDPDASNGLYVDMPTQTGSVTWYLNNVPQAGNYEIRFGYRCSYDTPKDQYINVNGERVDTLRFEGNTTQWLEKEMFVDLIQGQNTIQMELFWGWMHLDYLAVPTELVVTANDPSDIVYEFTLQQNYPNPFNPGTNIQYTVGSKQFVSIKIYDVLGREIATLVNEEKQPGEYKISFNGSNLSSGTYFYRLRAGEFLETKKLLLLK